MLSSVWSKRSVGVVEFEGLDGGSQNLGASSPVPVPRLRPVSDPGEICCGLVCGDKV